MNRPFVTLFLALVPAVLAGCSRNDVGIDKQAVVVDELAVEVTQVKRRPIESSVELVGTLIPMHVTTIVSDVDGMILSFPKSNRSFQYEENGRLKSETLALNIGHAVKAGDVLVQIDPTDFQLALNVAKAKLELANRSLDELRGWRRQEEVDRLEAACRQAQAAHDGAKADLDRDEVLRSKRVIAEGAHDATVMAYQTAAAALEQARAAKRLYLAGPTPQTLAVAEARVAAAGAEVALRQEKLNKTTIRARYDGVIADRYVDVGDRVTAMPRVEIMQMIDPRALLAQVSIPERYQRKITLDTVATITGDGVPGELPGRVDLINSKVDSETRTFRVRVTIDNRAGILKAGGFVSVGLPLTAASDVLVVPRQAVTFTEGRPAVFVYRDGRVRKTPVETGIADEARYELRSGVAEGESVVVGRMSLLADGMAVRATPWRQESSDSLPEAVAGVRP